MEAGELEQASEGGSRRCARRCSAARAEPPTHDVPAVSASSGGRRRVQPCGLVEGEVRGSGQALQDPAPDAARRIDLATRPVETSPVATRAERPARQRTQLPSTSPQAAAWGFHRAGRGRDAGVGVEKRLGEAEPTHVPTEPVVRAYMLPRFLKSRRARALAPLTAAAALASLASLAGASPASAACNTVGLENPDHHVIVCTTTQGASASATVDVCLDWSFPCQRVVDLGRTGASLGSLPSVSTAPPPQLGVKTSSATVATVYADGTAVPVTVPGVCAGPTGTFCP